jgi:HlyD family secretion protein
MDIARPSNARAKRIKRIVYGSVALIVIVGVTLGLKQLRPAAPTVELGTIVQDTVKRGPMLLEVHGLGTLVPEEIRWIPAQTEARVDRIVLRPGAVVKPGSIILELSDPQVQRDLLDAEFQLKSSEADYANLQVQVNSDVLNQRATAASVRSDYEQARLQHEVDEKLLKEGLTADVTANLSRVRAEQLAIRAKIEDERMRISEDAAKARLTSQRAKVEQSRALYNLRKAQAEALHVRAGINGVLQLVPVEVGAHVTPGSNLARVADPKKLMAQVRIAETQVKDVAIGQKAAVDTRNGIVPGHVTRIDPSVLNGTVTVDVEFDAALPQGSRADLSVDGTIEIANLRDVMYVGRPVHGQPDQSIGIFKISDDGSEAELVSVKLGRSSVSTVQIREGLKVGDKVILSDMQQWDSAGRVRLK